METAHVSRREPMPSLSRVRLLFLRGCSAAGIWSSGPGLKLLGGAPVPADMLSRLVLRAMGVPASLPKPSHPLKLPIAELGDEEPADGGKVMVVPLDTPLSTSSPVFGVPLAELSAALRDAGDAESPLWLRSRMAPAFGERIGIGREMASRVSLAALVFRTS